jgi:hypothetical protein
VRVDPGGHQRCGRVKSGVITNGERRGFMVPVVQLAVSIDIVGSRRR